MSEPEETAAAQRFADELRALHLAAGRPTLKQLVELGRRQQPPVRLNVKTLSDWLNGKSVPSTTDGLSFLVRHLEIAARQAGHQPPGPERWRQLYQAARAEKLSNRGGRPRNARETPSPEPARTAPAQDRPAAVPGRTGARGQSWFRQLTSRRSLSQAAIAGIAFAFLTSVPAVSALNGSDDLSAGPTFGPGPGTPTGGGTTHARQDGSTPTSAPPGATTRTPVPTPSGPPSSSVGQPASPGATAPPPSTGPSSTPGPTGDSSQPPSQPSQQPSRPDGEQTSRPPVASPLTVEVAGTGSPSAECGSVDARRFSSKADLTNKVRAGRDGEQPPTERWVLLRLYNHSDRAVEVYGLAARLGGRTAATGIRGYPAPRLSACPVPGTAMRAAVDLTQLDGGPRDVRITDKAGADQFLEILPGEKDHVEVRVASSDLLDGEYTWQVDAKWKMGPDSGLQPAGRWFRTSTAPLYRYTADGTATRDS